MDSRILIGIIAVVVAVIFIAVIYKNKDTYVATVPNLNTSAGQAWLSTSDGSAWLTTEAGQAWLNTSDGQNWLDTLDGKYWLVSSQLAKQQAQYAENQIQSMLPFWDKPV